MAKRRGISTIVALVVYAVLLGIGIIVSLSSVTNVVQTTVYIEKIAQGDTVLFTMLESSLCAPDSGTPLKYVLGIGLATGADPSVEIVDYNGIDESVDVEQCVTRFMDALDIDNYKFSASYGVNTYIVDTNFDIEIAKRTERMYISVPSSGQGVAEVVLHTNFLGSDAEAVCPMEDETHICTPPMYCGLIGSSCDEGYLCGGGSCCCIKQ